MAHQMKEPPLNVSDSVRRRNPHLYGPPAAVIQAPTATRIRQQSKPPLNKLELEWLGHLKLSPTLRVRIQALTFKLANGVKYTPDFVTTHLDMERRCSVITGWEVKGKHAWDDAIVKIKIAAHEWPEITWKMVWKENGNWKQQTILP